MENKTDVRRTTGGVQIEIAELLHQLDQYNPTIPENLSKFYLEKYGLNVEDPRICKFASLAADKFLVETIREAKLFRDIKRKKLQKSEPSDRLELQDLENCLLQAGISLNRKKLRSHDTHQQKDK